MPGLLSSTKAKSVDPDGSLNTRRESGCGFAPFPLAPKARQKTAKRFKAFGQLREPRRGAKWGANPQPLSRRRYGVKQSRTEDTDAGAHNNKSRQTERNLFSLMGASSSQAVIERYLDALELRGKAARIKEKLAK